MSELDLDAMERLAREAKKRAEKTSAEFDEKEANDEIYVIADDGSLLLLDGWYTYDEVRLISDHYAGTEVPALADAVLALVEEVERLRADVARLRVEAGWA